MFQGDPLEWGVFPLVAVSKGTHTFVCSDVATNLRLGSPPTHTYSRSPSSALLLFLGEGSPTKIDYREKGTLITSPLEDRVL